MITACNRIKGAVGIKRWISIDVNGGDVDLNEKKQIVDSKSSLMDKIKNMEYDDVL